MTAHTIDTVFLDAGGVLVPPVVDARRRRAGPSRRRASRRRRSPPPSRRRRATSTMRTTIGTTDDRARGWLYFNLVLHHAGVAQNAGTDAALAELREYHRHDNLWEHVEPDVAPALAALRGRGLRLVVVSNANGRLKHLFDRRRSHEVVRSRPRFARVGRRETRSAAVPAGARAVTRRRGEAPCTSAISITSTWSARARPACAKACCSTWRGFTTASIARA